MGGGDAQQMEIGLHERSLRQCSRCIYSKPQSLKTLFPIFPPRNISMRFEKLSVSHDTSATCSDGSRNGWQHLACDAYGGLRFLTHTTDKIQKQFQREGGKAL